MDSDEVLKVMADSGQRDVKDVVGIHTVRKRAESLVFPHLLAAVSRNGDEAIGGIDFNPKWPYLTPLKIVSARRFRKEAYCFLYYLLDSYKMGFSFNLNKQKIILKCMENDLFYRYLVKFFEIFKPLKGWLDEVNYRLQVHETESGPFGLLVLGRKYMGFKERETMFEWMNFENEDLFYYLSYDEDNYLHFKNEMIDLNGLETMSELDLLLENPFYSTHNYPAHYDKQMEMAFAWRCSKIYYHDEDMVYFHPDSADEYDSSNSDASEEI
ncbi:uncharacterized protein [Spinacia oleracea]|uniref:Uncharacterized protein n=1 Tax=Spinacia oleracea TaxID=3562 RepID=A0ABM3R4Z7_SPIOL|nr:uncharacterized protein LOC130465926 [Spinacia oleracea]